MFENSACYRYMLLSSIVTSGSVTDKQTTLDDDATDEEVKANYDVMKVICQTCQFSSIILNMQHFHSNVSF